MANSLISSAVREASGGKTFLDAVRALPDPLRKKIAAQEIAALDKQREAIELEKSELDAIIEIAQLAMVLPHPAWAATQTPRLRALIASHGYRDKLDAHFDGAVRHHIESKAPTFTLTDDLLRAMERSDISGEIRCEHVKLPTPNGCYFHLGKKHPILEGFYISPISGGIRFALIIAGEDDIGFTVPNSEQSMNEFIEQDASRAAHKKHIVLAVMILFYCSCAQYRTEVRPEYTEAMKSARSKMNPTKRARATKEAKAKFDYIVIRPQELKKEGVGIGQERSPHFRRGHFRMQKWGPRNTMEKMIFIQPCFVHGSGKIKNYIVD